MIVEEEHGKVKKIRRSKVIWVRRILTAVILILILAAVALLLYFYKIRPNSSFSSYEVIGSIDREDTEATDYLQFGSNLIKYNQNGISVIDGMGTIVWNASYEMQNPQAVRAGNYVAVGDIGNKELFVYNAKGSGTKVEITAPILKISLSEQGEVAVLMQKSESYHIQLFDPYAPAAPKKAEIETYIENDGYALDIGISKDGAKLVTSYFYLDGNTVSTNLTFYSFTGVGQAYEDRIVGAYPYPDQMIPKVEFLTNDLVCVFGEQGLAFYSMKQKPELIAEQKYEQKILEIFFDETCAGVVLEGAEESLQSQAIAYNLKGKEILNKKLDFVPDKASVANGDFCFYTEEECAIYRSNGQVKFKGELENKAKYFMHGKLGDHFFIITDSRIKEIRLTNE